MTSRSLHVAVELSPGAPAGTAMTAERAGFTFATFDDSPRLDAVTRAAYVATRTDRLGLAVNVTTAEPLHLAARLASLDHASHGRAAWVVGPGALHHEAAEVVEVVRRLWDSWDDDAVIENQDPPITRRPPQGRLVVCASDALAGAVRPDIVLVGGTGLDDVRTRARRARDTGAPLVFAEVEVRLGEAGRRPSGDRLRYTGSAPGLTELLGWLATSVDGVRLHFADPAAELPAPAGEVLPALRAEGLLTPPAPGATLRASLGLPRPESVVA
ncbi:Luciferase-like monooxygenase [Amycolatopsis tolypomycina]|uniref:Luciferase-like monooxygenase n=1 Tax=Amycolatopsis tolypomycina TaxID=208445 RepID=A0A1H4TRI2_9PSEU|nr:LLM class flavin-dependent oxidoreductase [Amycolatopsis tolypomycina]SEC59082.1 Luciferase-like monooxygenase [Amycolatopsis tolypomycina]